MSTLTGQRDARINDTLDIAEEGSKLEIWLSVQQEEYMYQRDSNMAGFNVSHNMKQSINSFYIKIITFTKLFINQKIRIE